MSDDSTQSDKSEGELVEVAKIGRAHGIKGEVRVFTRVPDWRAFESGRTLFLDEGYSGERQALTIEKWRIASEFVIAKFESIDDRNQAERLRNRMLSVPEADLPPLEEGDLYHYQLEGREVFVGPSDEDDTDEPRRVGRVAGVFETGANDVMVVDLGDDELYVPMFEGAVEVIEPDSQAVYLRPLEEWAPEGTEI